MSDVTRSLTQKSELSAARLALVSEAPVARRVARHARDENELLRAENERLMTENERLRVENMHLVDIGAKLGAMSMELKKENDLLTKENVDLCARLNRPQSIVPRKGRLPPREEVGARVVDLDDEPEPETIIHGTQKLVKVPRRKDAS